MTEEELKEKMDKDLNEVFNVKSIIDFQFDLLQKAYTKGLETGLKAGRQWHDLRKDPNDLPPMVQDERHISDRVWIDVGNWGTEDGYYDYKKNCWIIRCRIVNLPILGWIEIPTFDKEIE